MVRARLEPLRRFRWSSYRAYAGYEKARAWLCCQTVLNFGGGEAAQRVKHYRQYVEIGVREGYAESPWEGLVGRAVLGGRDFIEDSCRKARGTRAEQRTQKVLASRPDFAAVMDVVEKLKGQNWTEFCDRHGDWGRDLALYLGRRHGGLTLRQLAEAVRCGSAVGVSVAIKRFGQRLQNDRTLRALSERARGQLLNV